MNNNMNNNMNNISISPEIDPLIWGKEFWFILHTISFTYPQNPNDTAKRKYYDLIQNLPLFLPNTKVANEFADLLNTYPVKPYLDSRVMFVKWMHFIHNKVNKLNGKEEMTYSNFIQIMQKKYTLPPKKNENIIFTKKNISTGFVLSILIFIFFLDKKIKIV